LLIVIDGDKHGVAQRRLQLQQILRAENLQPIDPSDPVAILVPTWHIETWIGWLCGHRPMNEQTRYNGRDAADMDVHRRIEKQVYTAKLAVQAWNPPAHDEPTHVPSLTVARSELKQRLKF
jgi:hypothetical protein